MSFNERPRMSLAKKFDFGKSLNVPCIFQYRKYDELIPGASQMSSI